MTNKQILLWGGVALVAALVLFAVLFFAFGLGPSESALLASGMGAGFSEAVVRRQGALSSAEAAKAQVDTLAQGVEQRAEAVAHQDGEATNGVSTLTPEEKAAAGNTLFSPKGDA